MASQRRKARITALQALYEVDLTSHPPKETVDRLTQEKQLSEEAASFARELVLGVRQNRQAIDSLVQEYAPLWVVEQISPVDRNILRLAIFEILFHNRVPRKVAINEAVELAKAFGSGSSARFVNGVLGSIMAQVEKKDKSLSLPN